MVCSECKGKSLQGFTYAIPPQQSETHVRCCRVCSGSLGLQPLEPNPGDLSTKILRLLQSAAKPLFLPCVGLLQDDKPSRRPAQLKG